LSAAQDIEAGDGTTSVVVLCSSLLAAAEKMLNKGMHSLLQISVVFGDKAYILTDNVWQVSTPPLLLSLSNEQLLRQ
jgi:T-complex protein 1 subunit delta